MLETFTASYQRKRQRGTSSSLNEILYSTLSKKHVEHEQARYRQARSNPRHALRRRFDALRLSLGGRVDQYREQAARGRRPLLRGLPRRQGPQREGEARSGRRNLEFHLRQGEECRDRKGGARRRWRHLDMDRDRSA